MCHLLQLLLAMTLYIEEYLRTGECVCAHDVLLCAVQPLPHRLPHLLWHALQVATCKHKQQQPLMQLHCSLLSSCT